MATESQLELEWLGGPSERRLRASRPGFDDLPWDSFEPRADDAENPNLIAARALWTNGVFTEYASAAAFSALNIALLECQAPVDLCAAAADFAVDELVHVSLVSRLVMTLGGATPYLADMTRIAPAPSAVAGLSPRMRAAELAIKVSCVGEALSLPALSASHRGATHPLARAVLDRLRHDEGPHAAIGHWFLAWVDPWLTAGDREYLGNVATEAIAVYEPLWREAHHDTVDEHYGTTSFRDYMQHAVDERIVGKLAKVGIHCAAGRVDACSAFRA
ncbi:MAG TPA: ferritin-like domain-containing protein [Kofleriaceae bacterium]